MAEEKKQELIDLHGALAKELKKRIDDGTASAADLSAAAKFLKDNEVTLMIIGEPDDPLGALACDLPFPSEDAESMKELVNNPSMVN